MDAKPIFSSHALLAYLAKYCTKPEPASDVMAPVINAVKAKLGTGDVTALDNEALLKMVARRLFVKEARGDVSAPEVYHILLGYK